MDLGACPGVLVHMEASAQRDVLELFHATLAAMQTAGHNASR